jgi:hypothetical protein
LYIVRIASISGPAPEVVEIDNGLVEDAEAVMPEASEAVTVNATEAVTVNATEAVMPEAAEAVTVTAAEAAEEDDDVLQLDDVEFKQVPWQSSCGHRSLE